MTLWRTGVAATLILAIAALVYVLLAVDPTGPVTRPVLKAGESSRAAEGPARSAPDSDPAGGERETIAVAGDPTEAASAEPESYRRALGVLIGRIVEAGGEPAPDLPLELYGLGLSDLTPDIVSMFQGPPPAVRTLRGRASTDDEGRFRFEGLFPAAIHALGIDLRGPRTTVRFVDHMPNPGETVDLGDLPLEPFTALTGIVLDFKGEPVAGARVRASNLPALIFQMGLAELRPDSAVLIQEWNSEEWQLLEFPAWISELLDLLPVPQATTGPDGRFTLEAAPTGLASLLVDREGFVTKVHGPVPTGEAGGLRDAGKIRIDEGEELRGLVLDATGRKVPGAEVLVGREIHAAPLALVRPAGVTGADGRFRIPGLGDGGHLLAVRGPDQLDWLVEADLEPGLDEPVLRLAPTHDLTVSVVDGGGDPIENPELMLRLDIEAAEVPVIAPPIRLAGRIEPQEDGRLLIERLGAKTYELLVRAEGFAGARHPVDLTAGPAEVRVILEAEREVRIEIVAASSGEPLEWARVSAFRAGDWKRGMPVPSSSARSDARGIARLAGLREGQYRLRFEHPGFATTGAALEVPSEPLTVELTRGGTLLGRVRAGGQPVLEPRFVVAEGRDNLLRFAVTGAEGEFQLEALPPGTLRLEVRPRFGQQSPNEYAGEVLDSFRPERRVSAEIVEGQTTRLDIDLHDAGVEGPTARLHGRVLINGRPGTGWTLTIHPGGQWGNRKSTRTDAAGLFDFGQVPAGFSRVQLERAGDLNRGQFWLGGHQIQAVELAANEVRELLFRLETGGLRGRVIGDANGSGVGGAQISISSGEPSQISDPNAAWTSLSAVAESSGEFAFAQVPAGSYHVAVEADGYAPAIVGPVLVPYNGEPPPLEIRLTRGSRISGVVELPEDHEFDYLYLWLEDRQTLSHGAGTQADVKSGRFTLENVAPGSYLLNMAAHGGPFIPQEVEVPQGGLKDLRIQMKKAD